MKQIILALTLTFLTVGSFAEEHKIKKVCEVTKDASGKEKKVCKDVKIHKKLDGEKLPEKK